MNFISKYFSLRKTVLLLIFTVPVILICCSEISVVEKSITHSLAKKPVITLAGNGVSQHINSSGTFASGGSMLTADLAYLATAGRTCPVGEFGNGTNGTADWSGLVDYAKSKSWTILGWSWAGDGGNDVHAPMNMIAPNFQPYMAGVNYTYALSAYFKTVYDKL